MEIRSKTFNFFCWKEIIIFMGRRKYMMGRERGSRGKIRDKNGGEARDAKQNLILTYDNLSTILPSAEKEFYRVFLG
jgi:hypothetical protein